jgi:hypothetical protein
MRVFVIRLKVLKYKKILILINELCYLFPVAFRIDFKSRYLHIAVWIVLSLDIC